MPAKLSLASIWLLFASLILPNQAYSSAADWRIGGYGGRHYDTEPAGILEGNARFKNQSMLALTVSKSIWQAENIGLSLEIDGMLGHQFGIATLQEIGLAPSCAGNIFLGKKHCQRVFVSRP